MNLRCANFPDIQPGGDSHFTFDPSAQMDSIASIREDQSHCPTFQTRHVQEKNLALTFKLNSNLQTQGEPMSDIEQLSMFEEIPSKKGLDKSGSKKNKKKPADSKNIIEAIIAEKLDKHKQTLRQVSAESGVALSTLAEWANGKVEPRSGNNILKLANYWNISTDYLNYGVGDKDDEDEDG